MVKRMRKNQFWRNLTIIASTLYVLLSIVFIYWGGLNADEGWYLYASKLVYQGQFPYKDFAYTQMPLLPYIYGFPQLLFQPSVFLGRITSFIIALLTFLICLWTVNKISGNKEVAITALLFCSFTYGIYFTSIVKTYALVALFFSLSFFATSLKNEWKYLLVICFSFAAVLTRLSALFFAIPFCIYCVFNSKDKLIRYIVIILIFLFCFLLLELILNDSSRYDLFIYHVSQWGEISFAEKIHKIIFERIPDYFLYYLPYYIFLLIPIFILSLMHLKDHKFVFKQEFVNNIPILIMLLGLCLFSISHFFTGGWYIEYFVPAIMCSFPLLAIAFCRTIDMLKNNLLQKFFLECVFVGALILSVYFYKLSGIDVSGSQSPISELREVSSFVNQNSSPTDRIFALEALWVVLDANRQVLPGMTMAQFSVDKEDLSDVQKVKFVNPEMVKNYLDKKIAPIVIITDADWIFLEPYSDTLKQILKKNYDLILKKDYFGQSSCPIYIYRGK
jgi:hypothetical protein